MCFACVYYIDDLTGNFDHVARHELASLDALSEAGSVLANDLGDLGLVLLQGLNGALGISFLYCSFQIVCHNN